MDRQSEWIVLRRVLAFLKSRKLHRAAYALEKEARLKLDLPHLHDLFAKGRWRAADEYVTTFMSGKESTTPSASATNPAQCMQRTWRKRPEQYNK